MPKDDVKEWAIQDEATGEWWGGNAFWKDAQSVARWPTYVAASMSGFDNPCSRRLTARIVPAPPREMTDAECWEWLEQDGHPAAMVGPWSKASPERFAVYDSDYQRIEAGATPCDAIRAARKKLEGK